MTTPRMVVVLGATGQVGKRVVKRLLEISDLFKIHCVVREESKDKLDGIVARDLESSMSRLQVTVIENCVTAVTQEKWKEILNPEGYNVSIICCLGHQLTPLGIWGPPYRMQRTIVETMTKANPSARIVILANDSIASSQDPPRDSWADRAVLGMVSAMIPPHADLEAAASFLEDECKGKINWCIIRPADVEVEDSKPEQASDYELSDHPDPSIFGPAAVATKRQVAHCLVRLAVDDVFFKKHRNTMPVVRGRGKTEAPEAVMKLDGAASPTTPEETTRAANNSANQPNGFAKLYTTLYE